MKNTILFLLILSFSCRCNPVRKARNEQLSFDFNRWKNDISLNFNNMVKADIIVNPQKKINTEMINQEINILEKSVFEKNFEKALHENKVKKWKKLFIVYHFLEGEFNHGLSSYIFIDKRKCWGITYDHNSGKYFQVNSDEVFAILDIKPKLYGGGNGIAIISEFDNKINNVHNVIVAGVSYSESLEPLMKIYDEKIFD